jgi:predicted transcriptional regulator
LKAGQFLNRNFNGSLPAFIAAFIGDKKLTDKQEKVLKNLIDSFREDS